MTAREPAPSPAPRNDDDDAPRWKVVASRPDYSLRSPLGRFSSLEAAEQFAATLRAGGYRDVQIEPIFQNDAP